MMVMPCTSTNNPALIVCGEWFRGVEVRFERVGWAWQKMFVVEDVHPPDDPTSADARDEGLWRNAGCIIGRCGRALEIADECEF